jgi:hypothetical protein
MNTVATLALLFSLTNPHFAPPPRTPVRQTATQNARKGGRWYLADTGHAVYCYGPVVVMRDGQNGLQRVATFCAGDNPVVALRD